MHRYKALITLPVSLLFLAQPAQATLVSLPLEDLTGNLVVNPGYESPTPLGVGRPSATGNWSGDVSTIVSADQGISPRSGSRMLRHDATRPLGAGNNGAGSQIAGEILQLIDLTPYSAVISGGDVYASASAYFNRVSGDAFTDTGFRVSMRVYSGEPANFDPEFDSFIARGASDIFISDALPDTWESVGTDLLLPTDAAYIALFVSSREDVFNDTFRPEFDGHYSDDVEVKLRTRKAVPSPGPSFLFSTATLGLLLLVSKKPLKARR